MSHTKFGKDLLKNMAMPKEQRNRHTDSSYMSLL